MEEAAKQNLSPDEANRLWQHGLHLDTMLFQRSNLFLVAESLLVVSYASMLAVAQQAAGSDRPALAARVIAVFGLLLTLIWGYVGHRHLRYYQLVLVRIGEHITHYRAVREGWHPRGPSTPRMITYSLPALAVVVWILLLLITWR